MTNLIKVFLVIIIVVFLVGFFFGMLLKLGLFILMGLAIWYVFNRVFGNNTY